MPTGTITSKGQITIPKEVRERLRLTAGTRVSFVFGPKGGVTLKPVKTDIRAIKGLLKSRLRRPLSIAEMNAAIGRGYAGLR